MAHTFAVVAEIQTLKLAPRDEGFLRTRFQGVFRPLYKSSEGALGVDKMLDDQTEISPMLNSLVLGNESGQSSLLDAFLETPETPQSTEKASASATAQKPLPLPPHTTSGDSHFVPLEPTTLEEAGLSAGELEALALKYLLNCGTATGREVSDQLHLPPALIREALDVMKNEMLVTYKASAGLGDFVFQLTDSGIDRARRHAERCTYYGAAPVAFDHYIHSVKQQSLRACRPRIVDLCQAFADLTLNAEMISQLAQAISAGRGLFLYGSPGNGKTSIAERITRAFGQNIWIPRTLGLTGEMIRLFDPSNHEQVESEEFNHLKIDRRWVLIRRPTIIVGGELMLEHLDIQFNPATGINEAPVHMKSNGGTLVIDDFGRQRVGTADLLNRWIVPLEKQCDFLNLVSGRQVEIPFEQLLVLSTNLEPRDLVDEAFLRRIPYKIQVNDPTEEEFRQICRSLGESMEIRHDDGALDYLIEEHFKAAGRAMRYCHPRDILLQVQNLCKSHECPLEMTKSNFDIAVKNYFAVM